MSQLLTALLYVVGVAGMFLLLIGPHEGGHFLLAKLFKVRVIEFSIGAGTKLWSVTRGGTLYALRLVPILGYVRMGGMEAGISRIRTVSIPSRLCSASPSSPEARRRTSWSRCC